MLLSAVISLDPIQQIGLPRDQGRAVHAWFLDLVRQHDAALARAIHDDQGPKPFTCSSLMDFMATRDGHLLLAPGQPGWVRITSLSRELSTLMEERLLPGLAETVSLGDATLRVTGVATDAAQHPWAGRTTHATLVQQHMIETPRPSRRLRLSFASPTTFRRDKQHLPVPLPDLIVQGWLTRWNAFAEAPLPGELYDYTASSMAISAYRLHTESVSFGEAMIIGCVGSCTYTAFRVDDYWLRLLHTLAAYSFFCGTGHKTTHGLGQTRREE